MDPTSKIAKETFENFCDMWRYLVNDVIQVAKEILESFKSFSLLGGANTSAPLKAPPSNRTYFNSVFQNRDPFSVYPPRHQQQQQQQQQRLNNVNSVYRTPAPILTNVNGQVSRGLNNVTGGRSQTGYMDRGHPDGMPLNNDVRWQGQEDRRPIGSSHNYPGGKLANAP